MPSEIRHNHIGAHHAARSSEGNVDSDTAWLATFKEGLLFPELSLIDSKTKLTDLRNFLPPSLNICDSKSTELLGQNGILVLIIRCDCIPQELPKQMCLSHQWPKWLKAGLRHDTLLAS